MKKELWIFGDSFGDPNYGDVNPQYTRWWEYLEQHYTVKNFSLTGTGPRWMLKELYRESYNKTTSNINVLCLLSDPRRIDFDKLDPGMQHRVLEDKRYAKTYKAMVKDYLFTDCYATELISILNSLYVLSENFNKMLVWKCFPFYNRQTLTTDKGLNRSIQQNFQIARRRKNFEFVSHSLFQLSQENCLDMKPEYFKNTIDPRLNHFGEDMSKKIGHEVVKWHVNKHNAPININNLIHKKTGIKVNFNAK
jgi:hypothetical protein